MIPEKEIGFRKKLLWQNDKQIPMIDNETQNFGSLPKRKPEVRPSSVKFTMLYKIFKI